MVRNKPYIVVPYGRTWYRIWRPSPRSRYSYCLVLFFLRTPLIGLVHWVGVGTPELKNRDALATNAAKGTKERRINLWKF